MGPQRLMAVSDAGPLIHLHEIQQFSLLPVLFDLQVPESILKEATAPGRVPAALLQPLNLHQVTTAAPVVGLHRGELDCLELCRRLSCKLLLTDDLAARKAAHTMSIQPIGSVGIIARAHYQNHLSLTQAIEALEHLYSGSTLFITRAILDLAIQQLKSQR